MSYGFLHVMFDGHRFHSPSSQNKQLAACITKMPFALDRYTLYVMNQVCSLAPALHSCATNDWSSLYLLCYKIDLENICTQAQHIWTRAIGHELRTIQWKNVASTQNWGTTLTYQYLTYTSKHSISAFITRPSPLSLANPLFSPLPHSLTSPNRYNWWVYFRIAALFQ